MRTALVGLAIAALLVVGGLAFYGGDAADLDASGGPTTTIDGTVTDDGPSGDDGLGDPDGVADDGGGSVTVAPRTRDDVLGDLRVIVADGSHQIEALLSSLDDRHGRGEQVSDQLSELLDRVTVFGEGVITGVAITPETLAAVPDLELRHADLVAGIDDVYTMLQGLDPDGADDEWNRDVTDVLDALETLMAPLS